MPLADFVTPSPEASMHTVMTDPLRPITGGIVTKITTEGLQRT
jgi:hypothetical protein